MPVLIDGGQGFGGGEGRGGENVRPTSARVDFFARRRGENVENRNYRLPIREKSKNENFGTQKHEICTVPRRDAQIRNSIGKFQPEMRPEARTGKGISDLGVSPRRRANFERGARPFWGAPLG